MADVPNIKSAEKWVRQSAKRRARNLDLKTRLKTIFKNAAQGADAATASSVEAEFDRAAKRGIVHKNKAARKKSRLAKRVAAAAVAQTQPAPAKTAK
ncbi:MAG: 30S ribosomal protein S20, partial [Vulcanimicrobiaceae bacterium]